MYTLLCTIFKIKRAGMQDDADIYGTFSDDVAETKGIVPFSIHSKGVHDIMGAEPVEGIRIDAVDLERHGLGQTDTKKGPIIAL